MSSAPEALPTPLRPGLPDDLHTVAVDGGTTNTRARLLRGDRVVAEARRAIGARDVATTGTAGPLAAAIRDVIAEVCAAGGVAQPDRIVASGMLTSEAGLAAVPHVPAPAGIAELARGVVAIDRPEIAPWPILLVPGVRTPPADGPAGWAQADVMRGEECEVIGLWAAAQAEGRIAPETGRRLLLILPGSHTKLVVTCPDGHGIRIEASYTTLAGELLATLARHTILAASLPGELPRDPDPEALAAGAQLARRAGLGRTAFLVRVAALIHDWTAAQRAAFLIGAVAADDVESLARSPLLNPADRPILVVAGSEPLRTLYADLLASRLALPVQLEGHEAAAALGAALVAHCRAAWELRGRHPAGPTGPTRPA